MDITPTIFPYHYLIVDDDMFTSKCIAKLLARLGAMNIQTADNGKVATQWLDAADILPDIIICDLNMPELDGVEYILYLAQKNFSGGLIISGTTPKMLDSVMRLAEAHSLNVLGTLAKPIITDKITDLITRFRDKNKTAAHH